MGLSTRSGRKIEWLPKHSGRIAKSLSTLPGQKKRKARKIASTRSAQQNSQKVHSENQIKNLLSEERQNSEASLERMRTRSVEVTCRHFGRDRAQKYPGYFFCHACKMADDTFHDKSSRSSSLSRRFTCTANHTSWLHPTQMNTVSKRLAKVGTPDRKRPPSSLPQKEVPEKNVSGTQKIPHLLRKEHAYNQNSMHLS